jgi:hypothetical protein
MRSGHSEGWKPLKVGGPTGKKCPQKWILSHVAQDMTKTWFWTMRRATRTKMAPKWPKKGPNRQYRAPGGVECDRKRGGEGAISYRKGLAAVGCPQDNVSTRFWSILAHLALFGPVLAGGGPTSRGRPEAPTVRFWLKSEIWPGHHIGSETPGFRHATTRCGDGIKFSLPESACCLLLACLLAC